MVIILTGVSGSGKTTVGRALAGRLGWPYHDGDDHHPRANVRKLKQGIPLTEQDRAPWLEGLAKMVDNWLAGNTDAILACSALTEDSRNLLGANRANVKVVYLSGAPELLRERSKQREGSLPPASLLDSQFETLEPPTDALVIDVSIRVEEVVAQIRHELDI
jgi:carbohydrate kinase (thermoresistant glucokinase family)